MWIEKAFFKNTVAIILIFIILLLLYHTAYFFLPIFEMGFCLSCPIILASVFYYIFRPIVRYMETNWHLPRGINILILYLFIGVLFAGFIVYISPILIDQLNNFTKFFSERLMSVKNKTFDMVALLSPDVNAVEEIRSTFIAYLYQFTTWLNNNILDTVSSLAHMAMITAVIPFILYYLLKDDQKFFQGFLYWFPLSQKENVSKICKEIDHVLSSFITGQLLISFIMSIMLFIGYTSIGLPWAFLLALFAALCFTIPMVGTVLAIIPPLIVAMGDEPFMAAKVVIVMGISLIIEANIVTPQIMSHRLHIHPLILVMVILTSGSLYGIWGMLLATPVYAVVKVTLMNIRNLCAEGEISINLPLIGPQPEKKYDSNRE